MRKKRYILVFIIICIALIWGIKASIQSMEPAVGIIEIKGPIMDASETLDTINNYEKNNAVRAVIIRIDSPGGKIGPSQEIYSRLLKLNKVKPVVASMSSMAASGGYYIALASRCIYALPGTITGSIGVLIQFVDVSRGLNKLGINAETITGGKLKDAGSPFRPLTKPERAYFKAIIDDLHEQFMEVVSKRRKLPMKDVKNLADGRVFTGRQAKKLGLIDRIGGLDEAINMAKSLAHLKGRIRIIRPEANKGLLSYLIKQVLGSATLPLRHDLYYLASDLRLEYSLR
ncbi:MAG: signal peptide peptidase SppA [Deltaproteobacteria bacterium]|nr:MAG: signal peptide peptidase SppA [Deltaproteobacteria bacterium]